MANSQMPRWLYPVVSTLLALIVLAQPSASLPAAGPAGVDHLVQAADEFSTTPLTNLLVNPGFEEGFTHWQDASEVYVADGWVPWWRQGTPDQTSQGYFRRPEYTAELAEDIRNGQVYRFGLWFFHGEKAQRYFSSFGTHDAGLYQQVAVTPGDWLEFAAWVRVHSSDCDDPCVSPLEPCNTKGNSHGTYQVAVGIDPLGNTPAELGAVPPETVVWSPLEMPLRYDHWVQIKVSAQAQSDYVTVYLRGWPLWPVKDNTVYWDETSLRVLPGTPEPTETPGPTWTASPTQTPTVTSTPRPTRTPSVTPTITRTPVRDKHLYLPILVQDWTAPTPIPTDTPPPTPTSPATATPTVTDTPEPSSTPSATASATLTASFTPSPVASETATATPTPGSSLNCDDLVINGDFETDDGWVFAETERPPAFSPDRAYQGLRSLRLGTEVAGDDVEGWSLASQTLMLPVDAVSVTVRFAYYAVTQDDTGDWQEAILRTDTGVPVKLLLWLAGPNANTAGWRIQTVVLPPELVARLAGTSVELYLEVYNDGDGQPTALYIDDVSLVACRSRGALSARVAMSPNTYIVVRYPIRYDPAQENFWLPATCSELEFESLQLENLDVAALDLSNWTLSEVRGGNTFTFPDGFSLQPGGRIRIWTQSGPAGPTDLYWSRTDPVWDNRSDEAILRDTEGNEFARRGYP
jgi:hypothetical protein